MKTTLLPAGQFVRVLYYFNQRKAVFLKQFLVGFLVFGFVLSGSAQHTPTPDWSLFQKNTGINFHAKLSDCPRNAGYDRSNVLIKIENTTDLPILVEYHVDLFLAGKCSTCGDGENENTFHFSVGPNQVLVGDCDMKIPGLSLFADWLEPKVERVGFSGFDLSQLQVHPDTQEVLNSRNPFKNMERAQLILTIQSLRKEITAFEKTSGSSSNGWYRVTQDKLILALETLIKKDASALSQEASSDLFVIPVSELNNLTPSSVTHIEQHPERFLIKRTTK